MAKIKCPNCGYEGDKVEFLVFYNDEIGIRGYYKCPRCGCTFH